MRPSHGDKADSLEACGLFPSLASVLDTDNQRSRSTVGTFEVSGFTLSNPAAAGCFVVGGSGEQALLLLFGPRSRSTLAARTAV